jgi:inner membrane protein
VDNLTHTLAGALLGAALPAEKDGGMPFKARAAYCAVVTNLPDLDYLTAFGAAPFEVLNLHRGVTHSFLMAPVWGALIGGLAWYALRRRYRATELALLAIAAVLLHAALDLLTSYGVQLFAPLSAQPHALAVLFILDPWAWLLLGAGVALAWTRGSVELARGALLGFVGYVALCGALMLRAEHLAAEAAARRGLPRSVVVFPQPLTPTHWKVVVVEDDDYHTAYLDLLGGEPAPPPSDDAPWFSRVWSVYRPADALDWTHRNRYGVDPLMRGFARFAWSREELAEFRRFALLPQMYALSNEGTDAGCGWFTDLRFEHPAFPNPFVAGICHGPVDGRLSKSVGWRLAEDAGPPALGR